MGSFRHIVPTNGHVVFVLLITMYPKLSLRYDGIFWQRWGCSNYLIYPLVPPFYVCINCIICYLITCNHCFQCRVGWVRWECFSSHLKETVDVFLSSILWSIKRYTECAINVLDITYVVILLKLSHYFIKLTTSSFIECLLTVGVDWVILYPLFIISDWNEWIESVIGSFSLEQ